MVESDLNSDGYFYQKSFLSLQEVSLILSDLKEVFSQPSINGSIGYNLVSKVVKKSPHPFVDITSFSTFNLLDKISKVVSSNGYDMNDYYLSEFNALAEQGDANPLEWHYDELGEGAFLILIYLHGGDIQSGGAKYIKKTHKLPPNIDGHYISKDELIKYKEDIVNLSGTAGDLVCYNLNGYHSRFPTTNERIALRLMFVKNTSDKKRFDDFTIPLHLLRFKVPKTLYIHDGAPNLPAPPSPTLNKNYIYKILIKYLNDVVNAIVRKITRA